MKSIKELQNKMKDLLKKRGKAHIIFWHRCDGETRDEAIKKYFDTHESKPYDLPPVIIEIPSDEQIKSDREKQKES